MVTDHNHKKNGESCQTKLKETTRNGSGETCGVLHPSCMRARIYEFEENLVNILYIMHVLL
ncbi:hypothetical protein LguiA_029763 [Lonicera macranthoides]